MSELEGPQNKGAEPSGSSWLHVPTLLRRIVLAFGVVLIGSMLWRTAWVCDDAFITFRTLDNLVSGHGLRWNVDERVQSFTHPLWLLLHVPFYLVTREAYFTTLALSASLTFTTFVLMARRWAPGAAKVLLLTALLVCSKAFVDFATSGLENPLSNLLLVAFAWVFFGSAESHTPLDATGPSAIRRFTWLTLIASAALLTRPDAAPLLAPALAVSAFPLRRDRRAYLALLLGVAPLLLWEAFSVLYFGFPFPNTAYAKLTAGVEASVLFPRGLGYLVSSALFDPLTTTVILLGLYLGLRTGGLRERALALGILLHLVYVLRIGGDFMAGRFLTVPFVAAVILILRAFDARHAWNTSASLIGVLFSVGLGLMSPSPSFLSGADYRPIKSTDSLVFDERGEYFEHMGLVRVLDNPGGEIRHPWALAGRELGLRCERDASAQPSEAPRRRMVEVVWTAGLKGYFAGPCVHLVDRWALVDPLLARLPTYKKNWFKVGHFTRVVPEGYLATLATGDVALDDPKLAEFYAALALVVRGGLFEEGRLAAIWQLNTGALDTLIDRELYSRWPAVTD